MDTATKTQKARIGDIFPGVFPGMPMFAYVPNPYDCGRPAKVYPGDNTYYCVKGAPLCAVDAEDAALLAIRRTVCRAMNQCYGTATPAQAAAVEAARTMPNTEKYATRYRQPAKLNGALMPLIPNAATKSARMFAKTACTTRGKDGNDD